MSGRWLINGLLLVVLIGLGWLIRADLQRAHIVPTLTDLDAAEIYRVEIARTGEPTITLIQTAIGWRLVTPFQVDADNGRVVQLLELLQAPVERSFPATSVDLHELGLSPARLRLRLDARELQFGGTDPVGQMRYVACEGLVHLIQDRFYHRLIAPPIQYVSLQLVPRGFGPVFGWLGHVPLAPETLDDLAGLHAERIEILAETLGGDPVTLKSADGTKVHFLVSDDRRRWARLDQRLLYVLTDAPELTLDPSAVDPTPADVCDRPAEPASPSPDQTGASPTSIQTAGFEPGPATETREANPVQSRDTLEVPSDAVDPRISDDKLGKPPVFRLMRDGRVVPIEPPAPSEFRLPGEPDKAAPSGFGEDPFAPLIRPQDQSVYLPTERK
ncbi:MAG: hypothetical protein ACUVQI_01485 [Thermochromatium sp.]